MDKQAFIVWARQAAQGYQPSEPVLMQLATADVQLIIDGLAVSPERERRARQALSDILGQLRK